MDRRGRIGVHLAGRVNWRPLMITSQEFAALKARAFSPENPGYTPAVIEAPNGDGNWDRGKIYGHIAPKYGFGGAEVTDIYARLIREAEKACACLGLPSRYWPGGDSTIRVLHYPAGAGSAPHTDFDLFTLSLWRSHPPAFLYTGPRPDLAYQFPHIHYGELLTEITGIKATRHAVRPLTFPSDSAVFFVMPPLGAELPSGQTVGEWVTERKARSRATRGAQ